MARYVSGQVARQPPSGWPSWVLERSPGGYVPDDPAAVGTQSRQQREDTARRHRWREKHTDLTAAQFNAAATTERNRRNGEGQQEATG